MHTHPARSNTFEQLRAVDLWDGQTYRRAIILGGEPIAVEVIQSGPVDTPELHVTATAVKGIAPDEAAIMEVLQIRRLGQLNVFPSGDSGARNSVRKWLNLDASLDYEGVSQTIDPWGAYAGLIYLHLLLKGLADAHPL